MYGNDAISSDYWRHHIPTAPDLEATVIVGQSVVISLKEHLMQGARDYVEHFSPDPAILPGLVPVQRGWLMDIMQTTNGVYGNAELSDFRDGFEYTPFPSSPSTEDCFNYQFSNGSQLSNYGRINITIIKPLEPVWKIFSPSTDVYLPNRKQNEYSMSFDVTVGHSSFFRSPAYRIVWHIIQPEAKLDDDGVTRVYFVDKSFGNTTWNVAEGGKVTIINSGKFLPNRILKTDSDVVGIDPRTNAPYIPTNKFPEVWVEYINYPILRPLTIWSRYQYSPEWDTSKPDRYAFKVEDVFGKNWYRSGEITIKETL